MKFGETKKVYSLTEIDIEGHIWRCDKMFQALSEAEAYRKSRVEKHILSVDQLHIGVHYVDPEKKG